ncbi:MAG: hypothetical protein U9N84_00150 [Actinomycetota bacterium]|nr:hypothetical protein [Actinomycetota bacterium]
MTPDHNQNILQYLADLAPTAGKNTDVVERVADFAWLGSRPHLIKESGDNRNVRSDVTFSCGGSPRSPRSTRQSICCGSVGSLSRAPLPSAAAANPDGWAGQVGEEPRAFGIPVIRNYPVAGWAVDLAVGAREHAFGMECRVQRDGTATHVEQHMALLRAGWKIVDAFQSRWLTDPEGAAEMLSRNVLTYDRG